MRSNSMLCWYSPDTCPRGLPIVKQCFLPYSWTPSSLLWGVLLTFPQKPADRQCEFSATFILIAGDLAMNRHTEEQIISIFKANERGVAIAELARQNDVTEQTITAGRGSSPNVVGAGSI